MFLKGSSYPEKNNYFTVTDSIVIRGSTYFYLLLLVFLGFVGVVHCAWFTGFVLLLGFSGWTEKNMLDECLFLSASGLMIYIQLQTL